MNRGIAAGGHSRFGPKHWTSGALLKDSESGRCLSLEREFAAGHQDERSPDENGRDDCGEPLRRGPSVDRPSGMLLDEQACLERGQFMSGPVAALSARSKSCRHFNREVPKALSCCISPRGIGRGKFRTPPSASLHWKLHLPELAMNARESLPTRTVTRGLPLPE